MGVQTNFLFSMVPEAVGCRKVVEIQKSVLQKRRIGHYFSLGGFSQRLCLVLHVGVTDVSEDDCFTKAWADVGPNLPTCGSL